MRNKRVVPSNLYLYSRTNSIESLQVIRIVINSNMGRRLEGKKNNKKAHCNMLEKISCYCHYFTCLLLRTLLYALFMLRTNLPSFVRIGFNVNSKLMLSVLSVSITIWSVQYLFTITIWSVMLIKSRIDRRILSLAMFYDKRYIIK